MASRLNRVKVTIVYVTILTVVSLVLSRVDPEVQDGVIQSASTNLDNLGRGHVETLIVSAFVADAGPEYEWVPGLILLLAIGELLWGSRRFLITLAVCHVGATLLVAIWLVAAVHTGWLPAAVASEADVGMSYCAVGVLGALAPAIPRRWRLIWIGWWLGVAILAVVAETDFAYLGHVVSLVLGMAVAACFGAPRSWTPGKVVVLVLGATFGYLVLSNAVPQAAALVAGLAGAVLGGVVTLLAAVRRSRRGGDQTNLSADASTQSERHDSGGSSNNSPGVNHS